VTNILSIAASMRWDFPASVNQTEGQPEKWLPGRIPSACRSHVASANPKTRVNYA
jgi:hypothetical protein